MISRVDINPIDKLGLINFVLGYILGCFTGTLASMYLSLFVLKECPRIDPAGTGCDLSDIGLKWYGTYLILSLFLGVGVSGIGGEGFEHPVYWFQHLVPVLTAPGWNCFLK